MYSSYMPEIPVLVSHCNCDWRGESLPALMRGKTKDKR